MYRHGDVLIVAAIDVPATATPEPNWDGALAYGEVTGHAHRVMTAVDAPPPQLVRQGDQTYLVLTGPATVVHEEHGPIPLAPGNYSIIRQRVYEPDQIRLVAD